MTPLQARLVRLIEAHGPISVADYMAAGLFDPQHGYYTTREPFGAAGDFVTAPEISQMFGELVASWVRLAWHAMGRPLPLTIAEIGPGRGTLMKDMLRTFRKLEPHLFTQAGIAMVEASPRLADVQRRTLEGSPARLAWHDDIAAIPRGAPLIVVANELFDAIPARQFVRTGGRWLERMVALDGNGALAFTAGAASLEADLLPQDAAAAPDGAIFEVAPARTALMDRLAGHLADAGGAGLFIDYGHLAPGIGDTLQAVRGHRREGPLDSPGQADLTTHVDFAALAAVAAGHGLRTGTTTQGDFLLGLGLLERAGRLGAGGDDALRERLTADVERLAGTDAMGALFKVLAVAHPDLRLWPIDPAA